MLLSFVLSLVLLTAGLVLATWTSRSGDKNPLVTLAGLVLLLVGVFPAILAGTGLLVVARSLLIDMGLALLLVGALLAGRRQGGRPFFRLGLLTLFLGIAVAALLRAASPAPRLQAPEERESLLVELGPDDRIQELLPTLHGFPIHYERAFPSVTLRADEDLAQFFVIYGARDVLASLADRLRADVENVDFVEWNGTVRLDPPAAAELAPGAAEREPLANDPMVARQWALDAIRAHEAHRLLAGARPARRAVVAILDTGIDAAHEDLEGVLRGGPGAADRHGHGTHCAGIAGAATNNGRGVASLNWEGRFVEISGYQALPFNGSGTYESIAQAVIDAAQGGADVISMSLGDVAPTPPRVVAEAVAFAQEQGAIVVASAGNADEDAIGHMPSNLDGVIAVAALDADLRKARFSNTVGRLARPIAAPGVDILSLKPDGAYVPMSGTSMATPMVAGLLGVLRSLDPALSAADAYSILHDTGHDVADTPRTGRVIDAEAAVRAVLDRRRVVVNAGR